MATSPNLLACRSYDRRPPLVLLHAFPLDSRMWREVATGLAAHTCVLTPDLPGFGRSADLGDDADLDRWAARLDDLLEERLGDRPAVVCGMSMGGYVALRLAALRPDRLAGLVLADSRAAADPPAARTARDQAIARIESGDREAWLDELLPRLVSRSAPDAVVDPIRALALEQPAAALAAALAAMRDRPDSTDVLASLRCPVLVMVGELDELTPVAEAEDLVRRAMHGILEVIGGAGHLAHLEAPAAVTDALARFVTTIARSGRSFTPQGNADRRDG